MKTKKKFYSKTTQPNKRQDYAPRTEKDRIGQPTGLLDANGDEIMTGQRYALKHKGGEEIGVIFWNRFQNTYGLFTGFFYNGSNPMNSDSYGKFIRSPADNGMRMQLIPYIGKP